MFNAVRVEPFSVILNTSKGSSEPSVKTTTVETGPYPIASESYSETENTFRDVFDKPDPNLR